MATYSDDDWNSFGSYEEQQKLGLIRSSSYVPAQPSHSLTLSEQNLLGQAVQAAGHLVAHRQMSHLTKNDETPITNVLASLIYSLAYSAAGWLITAGLLFLLYNLIGGDGGIYLIILFMVWGCCFFVALYFNRKQGLHHSPAGLEHAEIQSRTELAKFVVEKHIELIKSRWEAQ